MKGSMVQALLVSSILWCFLQQELYSTFPLFTEMYKRAFDGLASHRGGGGGGGGGGIEYKNLAALLYRNHIKLWPCEPLSLIV